MTTNIVSIVGARPQFVKAAVVSKALSDIPGIVETIVHTGQHYDSNMSRVFFDQLGIPEPEINLGVGSASHGQATGEMMGLLEKEYHLRKPDIVLVYGDTNSTLAGSLAAAKIHIPVAHVEAGLRSYNKHMPEEINRILTDHVSEILFCPTKNAVKYLEREGISNGVFLVGDVMFDAALYFGEEIKTKSHSDFVLCTIHRAENTDDKTRLQAIFGGLSDAGKNVVIPLHPRTKKMIERYDIEIASNIKLIEPQSYLSMLELLAGCGLVATDSGGLQKEAYFFGKPCVVVREETEWQELIDCGANTLAGANRDTIQSEIRKRFGSEVPRIDEYGDGHASEAIAKILSRC